MLLCASPFAYAVEPQPVRATDARLSLDGFVEAIEDPDGELTLDRVRARADAGELEPVSGNPSYGFTGSVYWFHFRLASELDARAQRLFEVGYPVLDQLDLYVVRASGELDHRRAGDRFPFDAREIEHRNFVFAIWLDPGEVVDVYLRIDTESSMQVPMALWTYAAFAASGGTAQIGFGIFYGVLVVMTLYNLFLFVGIRDRSYLYFCLFGGTYALIQAAIDGFAYQYLWPSAPALNSRCLAVAIPGANLLALQFMRTFLDLRVSLPRADRLARIALGVDIAAVALAAVGPYAVSVRVGALLSSISALLFMVIGLLALRAGFRSARFFVLAWGAFLLGTLMLVAGKFGVLPIMLMTEHGPRIGAVMMMLLLSFALADRINLMKTEKEQAQRRALEAQGRAMQQLEAEVARQTRELRDQAERLRELDDQKTRFFQNVSHELRTPLTLIMTPLEQLAGDERLRGDERIETSIKNARRLLRLVNQLLDFQKLAAGKRDFRIVPIEIGRFVRSMSEYARPTCERRDIRLVLETPGEPVVIRAEADALEKIVFNYLSNALKFTPDGGSIALAVEVEDGNAVVSVTDTGPGISDEVQKRLFRVFSQGDHDDGETRGTGLGLALVKELAIAMGGEVGLRSAPGQGSRFSASFPVVDEVAEAAEREAVPRAMRDQFASATGAHRIITESGLEPPEQDGGGDGDLDVLVVDDLREMRALVQRVLAAHGYRTAGIATAAEALELARHRCPRLILTDWMMPKMTGPELIAELRADAELSSTPVVLLTAKSGDESRAEGVAAGADAFLGKPFDEGELVSVVRNLLQLKSREREVERLNAELRAERDLLEQARETTAELTRFIVHDLKNPLTVIGVSLDFALDDPRATDDIRANLEAALTATGAMQRMVLDLLDVGRSEDGELRPDRRDVTARELFDEVSARLGRAVRAGGQTLEVSASADATLCCDRELVCRILANLIENAAKYGPSGGAIRLDAARDGDSIVLSVTDRGPGIPPDQRERVFDKYHRLERHRDAETRSSRGLGLVFCRVAAEAHGGAIWIEDAAPGCRFCVRLPAAAPRAASATA